MKRYAWLTPGLSLMTVLACGDKDDTGGAGDGGGTGDGGSGACEVEVDSYWPTKGATDAYYRTQVEFTLSAEDPEGTPTITLVDGAGTNVAGSTSLSENGKTVYFYPSSPLQGSTSYTATLSYCGGDASFSFTTSSLGEPLSADLVGKGYVVDLQGARFVEPAGVAELLLGELNNSILLGVEATSPMLKMIGAISTEGTTDQDICEVSIDFPEADFSESPFFSIGPQDTTIVAAGYEITISQLNVSGTFAADGSYFGGGVLAGELDARVLAPLVGELLDTTDPDQICKLLVGFGVACESCASDGQPYCISVLVEDLVATELGESLQVITEADITANPDCKGE